MTRRDLSSLLRESQSLLTRLQAEPQQQLAAADASQPQDDEMITSAANAAASVAPLSSDNQYNAQQQSLPGLGLPTLHRSLPQLEQLSRKLAQQQQFDAMNDSQQPNGSGAAPPANEASIEQAAQLYLARRGVDVQRQQRQLQALAQAQQYESQQQQQQQSDIPLEQQQPISDLTTHLAQQHTSLLNSILCQLQSDTEQRATQLAQQQQSYQWSERKRHILSRLGFQLSSAAAASTQQDLKQKRSTANADEQQQTGDETTRLTPWQQAYARVLVQLNATRRPTSMLSTFPLPRALCASLEQLLTDAEQGHIDCVDQSALSDTLDLFELLEQMLTGGQAAAMQQQQLQSQQEIVSQFGNAAAASSRAAQLMEQQFAEECNIESTSNTAASHLSSGVQSRLVTGALAYNESLFALYVKEQVASQPRVAQLSGRPGAISLLQAYLKTLAHTSHVTGSLVHQSRVCTDEWRDTQGQSCKLFPLVFYLWRCGHRREAVQVMQRSSFERSVLTQCMQRIVDAQDAQATDETTGDASLTTPCSCGDASEWSAELWLALHTEFAQQVLEPMSRSTAAAPIDPYKTTMYHLIGHFAIPASSAAGGGGAAAQLVKCDSLEDYMWLKLSFVLTSSRSAEPAANIPANILPLSQRYTLTLGHVAQTLQSRGGARHFDADGRNALGWAKLLLQCGEFERAVHHLAVAPRAAATADSNSSSFQTALHLALVLRHYGLLRSDLKPQQQQQQSLNSDADDDELLTLEPESGRVLSLDYQRMLQAAVDDLLAPPRRALRTATEYIITYAPTHQQLQLRQNVAAGGASATGLPLESPFTANVRDALSTHVRTNGARVSSSAARAQAAQQTAFRMLRELLLQVGTTSTGATRVLCGELRDTTTGIVQNGLLYVHFGPTDADRLLASTGIAATQRGAHSLGVELLLLARHCDEAAQLLVRLLSQSVSDPHQSQSAHSQQQGKHALLEWCARLLRLCASDATVRHLVSSQSLSHLELLHRLATFYSQYHAGQSQYATALRTIDSTRLLPQTLARSEIEACTAAFDRLAPEVQRCMSQVCVDVMQVLHVLYEQCKRQKRQASSGGAQAAQVALQRCIQLKQRAQATVSFVSMWQQQIGSQVAAQLLKTESLMV